MTQLCGVPLELSKNLSNVLRKYFAAFTPKRRVIKKVELKGLTGCFDLPEKVGNYVLSCEASGAKVHSEPVVLTLKDGLSESTLLDTGTTRQPGGYVLTGNLCFHSFSHTCRL